MTCQHRRSDTLDIFPAADVADVVLAPELRGECAQTVLAAGEQHHAPAFAGQRAGDRLADPTRRTGDDGYAVVIYWQTFT
jgi:hypothetical protein